MGTLKDFATGMTSDLMLPLFKTTLVDVVFDILNEREIPNRTQFGEIRDLVNSLRGPVSSATSSLKKLESRVAALEEKVDQQAQLLAKLESPPTKPTKKKAPAKKAPTARAPKKGAGGSKPKAKAKPKKA